MRRCLQLAELGIPAARPNPLVGSVIVHDGRIIGEGYHNHYGGPHAEVGAIRSADSSLLPFSTIYVNLEPCAHFGKTPPCADLIIEKRIPRVVISCTDTFSEVSGKGIERLREAGIEVVTGVLEKEGRWMNRRFFNFHERKCPYIILKWAESADGFMDLPRSANEKGVRWITGPETKQLVHKWRSEEAAIVVGHNTWINDQPALDVREVEGKSPIRIIMSTDENLSGLTETDHLIAPNPYALIEVCNKHRLSSVFIEGGSSILKRFIDAGLWNEARVFKGSDNFEDGLKAPVRPKSNRISEEKLPGGDFLTIYYND